MEAECRTRTGTPGKPFPLPFPSSGMAECNESQLRRSALEEVALRILSGFAMPVNDRFAALTSTTLQNEVICCNAPNHIGSKLRLLPDRPAANCKVQLQIARTRFEQRFLRLAQKGENAKRIAAFRCPA